MSRVRVVGIGSPLGADGVGLEAARRLRDDPRLPAGVEVRLRERPGPALIAELVGVEAVVLLDAVAGGAPGRVLRLERAALLAGRRLLSTHAFGVAEALALAEALDRLPERLLLLGVETGPETRQAPPAVAIAALCEEALRVLRSLRLLQPA